MGVRREVDRGRESQQTKVVVKGVGVPIRVLKFPASEVYESAHSAILTQFCATLWILLMLTELLEL